MKIASLARGLRRSVWGRKGTTRFLAVAVAERVISTDQALEIEQTRRRSVELGLPMRSGEAAIDLGYMTPPGVSTITESQHSYRANGKSVDDPLAEGVARHGRATIALKPVLGAGAIVALVAAFATRDDRRIDLVAGVVGALWVALEAVLPAGLKGRLSLKPLVNAIPILLAPLSIGYLLFVADRLVQLSSDAAIADHLWYRFTTSLALLTIVCVLLLIAGKWRHREVSSLSARIDLTRTLVANAGRQAAARAGQTHGTADTPEAVHDILSRTAKVISLNPFESLLRRLAELSGISIGGTSLWYMVPDGGRFRTRSWVAPGAPDEARTALERVSQYRPVAIDDARYARARERSRLSDGSFSRERFLTISDRADFVSLTGYVFSRGVGVIGPDTNQCLVFDRSFQDLISRNAMPKAAWRWIDFRSVAAYPVFPAHQLDARPVGVLVAYKCVKNGFTTEDRSALITAAAMLGAIYDPAS